MCPLQRAGHPPESGLYVASPTSLIIPIVAAERRFAARKGYCRAVTDPIRTRFGVLAYGSRAQRHREAAVALLTIQAYAPPSSDLVLLTDRPEQYRWFGSAITIDALTAATIRAWRGPSDDPFRPSLEALRRLASDSAADVVLLDADTMARRDLAPITERLAAGAVFMHRREYSLATPPRKGDRRLAREIAGRSWQGITLDGRSAMWNAGVVGSSRRHADIFDRTLAVFDEIRPITRYFAVDQLACSIVLPAYTPIEEAAPWFDHYWANRPWFNRATERFLSRALLEGLTPHEASSRLKDQPIVGPLDGRAPWWLTRLRGLISPDAPNDDHLAQFHGNDRVD